MIIISSLSLYYTSVDVKKVVTSVELCYNTRLSDFMKIHVTETYFIQQRKILSTFNYFFPLLSHFI